MKDRNKKILFIPINQVPNRQKITHANPVFYYFPRKDDPYCVIITICGDKLPYPSYTGSLVATLLEVKNILNSVVLTPGSQFICANIKDYFLCSPMELFKYIKIPICWITKEIQIQYNVYYLVEPDGYMYCKVRKCMYGLKQAAHISFGIIVKLLAPHGYFPVQ